MKKISAEKPEARYPYPIYPELLQQQWYPLGAKIAVTDPIMYDFNGENMFVFVPNNPYEIIAHTPIEGEPGQFGITVTGENGWPWLIYYDSENDENFKKLRTNVPPPRGYVDPYATNSEIPEEVEGPEPEDIALSTTYDPNITDAILEIFKNKVLWGLGVDRRSFVRYVLEKLPFMPYKDMRNKKGEIEEVVNYMSKVLGWLVYDPKDDVFKPTAQGIEEIKTRFGIQ